MGLFFQENPIHDKRSSTNSNIVTHGCRTEDNSDSESREDTKGKRSSSVGTVATHGSRTEEKRVQEETLFETVSLLVTFFGWLIREDTGAPQEVLRVKKKYLRKKYFLKMFLL